MSGNQNAREIPISRLPTADQLVGEEIIAIVQDGVTKHVKIKLFNMVVDKQALGLDRVDNTPDADKPISTKQQQALNEKADKVHTHEIQDVNGLEDALFNKANRTHGHDIPDIAGLEDALAARPTTTEVSTLIEQATLGIDTSLFVTNPVTEW